MYITLENATKTYGAGSTAVHALNHASLALEKGQICAVLGPSGSGKTTLINILGGLSALDEGSLTVGETAVEKLSKKQLTAYRRSQVGFVFQFYNLIPDLTVLENVQVAASLVKNSLDPKTLLADLGLGDLLHRFPSELSGGQQQRVAIARAMAKRPSLLLCDEPTGALDTEASRVVLECIRKMNADHGTTVVLITHNEAIAAMADLTLRLRDGAVVKTTRNATKLTPAELEL